MKKIAVMLNDELRQEQLEDFRISYMTTIIHHLAEAFIKDYKVPLYTAMLQEYHADKQPQKKDERTAEEIRADLLKRMGA